LELVSIDNKFRIKKEKINVNEHELNKNTKQNMNDQKQEFESNKFEHLGIIVGIIDEIRIVEKINDKIGRVMDKLYMD
jgi:hypothetical protein